MPGVLAALVALTTAGAAFEPALLRPAFADEEEYSAPTSAIGRRRELLRQAREKAEAAAAGNVKQAESAAAADEAVNDANGAAQLCLRRARADAWGCAAIDADGFDRAWICFSFPPYQS